MTPFLVVLLPLAIISVSVTMLLKLDQLSRRKPAPYTRPVISNEEYVYACSGGHVADLRRTWATASVYARPVITHQAIEAEADQPIEVPNWPVKVVKL